MKNPDDIIQRAWQFLKQEREMFGDWSLPAGNRNSEVPEEQKQSEKDPSAGSHQPVELQPETEKAADPNNRDRAPSPLTEKGEESDAAQPELLQKRLEHCSTLDELRTLCECSGELKTDLDDTRLVFGVGNPQADLMLIGEAPGFYEDQQGEPFVGKAGQLLNKILKAIHLDRQDVYIANILKHRPPDNRDPKPEERKQSLPFLLRQIELIRPRLILCLGRVSATTLLERDESLSRLRGRFHPWRGMELMVTYHPAALLRNQQWKRPAWEDIQKLRERYDQLNCQP